MKSMKIFFKTLIILPLLLFSFSWSIYAQEEEAAVDGAGGAGEEFVSFGVTFQYWAPFTETSTALGDVAGLTGSVSGAVTGANGENAEKNLNVISTEFSTIFTVEYGGAYAVDNFHLDFTENTDFSRLNPFDSRPDHSSKISNINHSLKSEKLQTSRIFTQFNVLPIPDVFDLAIRFNEENFVSEVQSSKDTLFLSFSGSEALIKKDTKIKLETSFEDKMVGLANFLSPAQRSPSGF